MLVKMPRGPVEKDGSSIQAECGPFEAALRRDLASTPVISYESTIGGWPKRAFDLTVTIITAPIWLTLLVFAMFGAKLRRQGRALFTDERVGYGGRVYRCYHLRLDRPAAEVLRLRPDMPANDLRAPSVPVGQEATRQVDLEWLPQMLNVLRGDMSLVGPAPLSRSEVEPLKTAKRYYLSARPGVVGLGALLDDSGQSTSSYKAYSLCWSLAVDLNLLLAALAPTDRGRARKTESASNRRG